MNDFVSSFSFLFLLFSPPFFSEFLPTVHTPSIDSNNEEDYCLSGNCIFSPWTRVVFIIMRFVASFLFSSPLPYEPIFRESSELDRRGRRVVEKVK